MQGSWLSGGNSRVFIRFHSSSKHLSACNGSRIVLEIEVAVNKTTFFVFDETQFYTEPRRRDHKPADMYQTRVGRAMEKRKRGGGTQDLDGQCM